MFKTKLMTGLLAADLTIGAAPLYAGDGDVTLIHTAISTAISCRAPRCAVTTPAAAWKAGWRTGEAAAAGALRVPGGATTARCPVVSTALRIPHTNRPGIAGPVCCL